MGLGEELRARGQRVYEAVLDAEAQVHSIWWTGASSTRQAVTNNLRRLRERARLLYTSDVEKVLSGGGFTVGDWKQRAGDILSEAEVNAGVAMESSAWEVLRFTWDESVQDVKALAPFAVGGALLVGVVVLLVVTR